MYFKYKLADDRFLDANMENEIKMSLYSFQFKADFSNLGKFSHFLAHKNILMSELLLRN